MEKNTCIFLTSRYPFGKTESFIENEIGFLSKFFKKIIIISLDSGKGKSRDVPNNVVVYPLKIWDKYSIKLLRLFVGFFAIIKGCQFEGHGFHARVQYWYDKGATYIIFRKLKRIVGNNVVTLDNTIFYSYWLDNNAAAISLFKRSIDKKHKALYIARTHGSDLYAERIKTNFLPMQKYIINSLDWILPISNHGLLYLEKKYPLNRGKFKTFYLGTQNYGLADIPNNDFVSFLSCSNIIPLKRLTFFADAFCDLTKICKVKWICIGSGSDEEKIKSIIHEKKCDSFVEFKGRLSNKEVIDFYKNNPIDFFVNVSEYEGLPISIMEACSFGVPIIATNVGAVNEIVNECNGFLIDEQSTSAILKTLRVACNLSKEEKKEKRSAARVTWEESYDSNKNYISFYNFLLKNGDRPK